MQTPKTMHLNPASETSKEPNTSPPTAHASQLQEEISFWQEMLSAISAADHPAESVERIQQALALAKFRLSLILPPSSH